MTLFARRPALRWLVPLLAALVLAGAGATIATTSAGARASLKPRSAAQLLVDVQEARVKGLSGTVVQTANLGLPALPSTGGGSGADFTGLVSGSHTLRVWYAGPTRARLALLGNMSESDLVRNGSDVWLWSSTTNTARHLTVPASSASPGTSGTGPGGSGPAAVPLTPQQAADRALKAITPSTSVTTDPSAVVAGRPAYQLVLQPKDTRTLIGTVRIAIDGKTHVPLRVQVFPRGSSTPAFEVGFTSFDPSVPSRSVFAFNPPPGAKVSQGLTGMHGMAGHRPTGPGSPRGHAGGDRPTVVGSGYAAVVVAPLPTSPSSGSATSDSAASGPGGLGSLQSVLTRLPKVSGSWGTGHLLRGTLFSVLLTDDGRVVAGAVAPQALYAALSAS